MGLLVALAICFYLYSIPNEAPEPESTVIVADAATQPKTLHIPTLELTAPIIALGIDDTGEFVAPDSGHEVGWYLGGGYPGSNDPAQAVLLSGHLTGPDGQPAVFADLDQLQPGEIILIGREDNTVFSYTVAEIYTMPLPEIDMAALMASASSEQEGVTLITCAGGYDEAQATYAQRLIVRAVLENEH